MPMTMQEWQSALTLKCEQLMQNYNELCKHADSFALITDITAFTEEEMEVEMVKAMIQVDTINQVIDDLGNQPIN